MELRKATTDDVEDVMLIFEQARRAQRAAGFRQWEDGYPSVDVLMSDIIGSVGYILDECGRPAGYIAIATRDEEYNRHGELWNVDDPCAVSTGLLSRTIIGAGSCRRSFLI